MKKMRRIASALVALIALAGTAQAVQSPEKDPWIGKTISAWDEDQGNWVATVDNPGGFKGFKEGEHCGLGNEWKQKVVAKLQPGWYVAVMVRNKPRHLPPNAPWNLSTPQCPRGTLEIVRDGYLSELQYSFNQRQEARHRRSAAQRMADQRAAREAAEEAARRKALVELLRKKPDIAALPR